MAVKIRLRRMGQKKAPFYRIVVADSRCKRDGRCIAEIGTYDPNLDPSVYKIDEEAAKKWLAAGAQPTEVVAKLLQTCRNREIIPDRFQICARKGRARRYVMKQLVEVIAKSLVENPDEVVVTED